MRLFLSVMTGYLIFLISSTLLFQLWGRDPHAAPDLVFAITSVICGILFAFLAGFWAVKCSRPTTMAAAYWVSGLISASALLSLMSEWRTGTIWSQLSALLLMAPAVIAGGWISRRRQYSGTTAIDQDRASSQ